MAGEDVEAEDCFCSCGEGKEEGEGEEGLWEHPVVVSIEAVTGGRLKDEEKEEGEYCRLDEVE